MKDRFLEKMRDNCDKGVHVWSEWRPFSKEEDERHCTYCSQTEYENRYIH